MPRPTACSFSYRAAVSMCRYPAAIPAAMARCASRRSGYVPRVITGIA
ncbi:hypothetical protein [Microbacterium sp. CPCC 204701]|nr:hypothetical protein [Microbacterium sp. CPCC 204701]